MTWEDLYTWIESYAGVSYDLTDLILALSGDTIFLYPTTWRNFLSILLERLNEMIDVINENYRNLPEDAPPRDTLKTDITSMVLTNIVEIVNDVKQKLGIEPSDIRRFVVLEKHVDALCDLIRALSENSLEKLMKDEWFDEYENDNDDFLTMVFQISKNDLPSMQFAINDIRQMYEEEESE